MYEIISKPKFPKQNKFERMIYEHVDLLIRENMYSNFSDAQIIIFWTEPHRRANSNATRQIIAEIEF